MAKIHWKGSTLLGPVPPVMVTCGDMEQSNIITVAWAGIINTHPPRVSISVRPTRHSYEMIKKSGEFVINLTSEELTRTADYCGIFTGAKVDKFAACNLTRVAADEVATPMIGECPLSLCCKVTDVIELGSHDMFLADIVAVYVDEELLDERGKLHIERAELCAYAHGDYYALGKHLGHFGFSAVKRKKHDAPRRPAPKKQ